MPPLSHEQKQVRRARAAIRACRADEQPERDFAPSRSTALRRVMKRQAQALAAVEEILAEKPSSSRRRAPRRSARKK